MTGYGQSTGVWEQYAWVWDIKSSNHLEAAFRPSVHAVFAEVERHARLRVNERLRRGDVWARLRFISHPKKARLVIDERVLEDLLSAAQAIQGRVGGPLPSVESIMFASGALRREVEDEGLPEEARTELSRMLCQSFDEALDDLWAWRFREGRVLGEAVDGYLRRIGVLARRCKRENRVSALRDGQRRSDVEEELQRILHQVQSGWNLLRSRKMKGAALLFLGTELKRETHAVLQKGHGSPVGFDGEEMHILAHRLCEQAANIE